jgi:type IV pilus assembly protein PilV
MTIDMGRIFKKMRSDGFSLVEVLVALMVLSIGLLGLAALQVTGIKFNHQSYQRTQATMLTYEIADRMRANPLGLANYIIAYSTATPSYSTDCAAAACTAPELTTYDLNKWRNALKAATGSEESGIAQSGLLYTIEIRWKEQDLQLSQRLTVQL